MKRIGYRTKIMLLSLFAALFLMPTGWGAGVTSIATLGPEPVLAQEGTPIGFGDNVFTTIGNCSGEKDTYTFLANADDVVVIRVIECGTFGCGGSGFEPCIELRDEAGRLINSHCGHPAIVSRIGAERLLSTSTYSLIVSDGREGFAERGAGLYALFVQRTNNPGRAEPLASGDNLLVTLNNCGEVDTYTFNAFAGDRVRINMVKAEIGNIIPRLELYDSRGRAIAIPGSGSINQVVTSSGKFTLLAYSNGPETGSYRLSLILPPPRSLNIPLVFTGQTGEEVRQTSLVLVNTSDDGIRGTLEFFEPDGVTPLEVIIRGFRDFQFPVSIPAGGVQILETEGTRPLVQGIARLTTDVGGLKANVILRSVDQMGQVVFEMIYDLPTPTRALTVPADSVGPATDTGLVILNPPPFPDEEPQAAMVTLRLFDRRGDQVGDPVVLEVDAGALATGPEGEVIRFMSELFPDVPGIDEFQGTIVVSSSVPVSVLAVQKRGDRLTVVPVF